MKGKEMHNNYNEENLHNFCNTYNQYSINPYFYPLIPSMYPLEMSRGFRAINHPFLDDTEDLVRSDMKMEWVDYGPEPFVIDIEEETVENNNYRTALWTGENLQLTLMSIRVGGDIGLEIHTTHDQFLRIEEGEGFVQMGDSRDNLSYQKRVSDGYAIFIPAGTWHNLINTGNIPIKLYSIYAPPQHPKGTIHETKEIAEEAEENSI